MTLRLGRTHPNFEEDPLNAWNPIPAVETKSEKDLRLKNEAEAKLTSDKIDEGLKHERRKFQKSAWNVQLLLLGQAESGKSTLQKQFQLMHSPNSLESERASWRAVVYFNVVHSLKYILKTLATYKDIDDGSEARSPTDIDFDDDGILPARRRGQLSTAFSNSASRPTTATSRTGSAPSPFGPQKPASAHQIANLRLRLSPLVSTDEQLGLRLSGGTSALRGEVYVRSGWQSRTIANGGLLKGRRSKRNIGTAASDKSKDSEEDPLLDDVAAMLEASKDDVKELWEHPTVVSMIENRKLKLDEWADFFLNNIHHIAKRGYIPTTDDILHARIQTMGIAEHTFEVKVDGKTATWHLYDVGGTRGQRHTWAPYFDSANALIFVAPISAFDQFLEEDPKINRIDDSLQLFTQICTNPLLKRLNLVLFLNKIDLLQTKLDKGLRVSKYIPSFGDRANEYDVVAQYFRTHFLQIHRKNNESRRTLYTHFTSVVNTKTTQTIITSVADAIFRNILQVTHLV